MPGMCLIMFIFSHSMFIKPSICQESKKTLFFLYLPRFHGFNARQSGQNKPGKRSQPETGLPRRSVPNREERKPEYRQQGPSQGSFDCVQWRAVVCRQSRETVSLRAQERWGRDSAPTHLSWEGVVILLSLNTFLRQPWLLFDCQLYFQLS